MKTPIELPYEETTEIDLEVAKTLNPKGMAIITINQPQL